MARRTSPGLSTLRARAKRPNFWRTFRKKLNKMFRRVLQLGPVSATVQLGREWIFRRKPLGLATI
jgi:hypothetical protein